MGGITKKQQKENPNNVASPVIKATMRITAANTTKNMIFPNMFERPLKFLVVTA